MWVIVEKKPVQYQTLMVIHLSIIVVTVDGNNAHLWVSYSFMGFLLIYGFPTHLWLVYLHNIKCNKLLKGVLCISYVYGVECIV